VSRVSEYSSNTIPGRRNVATCTHPSGLSIQVGWKPGEKHADPDPYGIGALATRPIETAKQRADEIIKSVPTNEGRSCLASMVIGAFSDYPSTFHRQAAAYGLAVAGDHSKDDRLEALAGELRTFFADIASRIDRDGEWAEGRKVIEPNTLDRAFFDALSRTGKAGKLRAKQGRQRAKARQDTLEGRWRLWVDLQPLPGELFAKIKEATGVEPDPKRFTSYAPQEAAGALWLDIVKPRLDEQRKNIAATARAVYADTITPVMTKQIGLPGIDDTQVRDLKGRTLGTINTVDADAIKAVWRGLGLLDSVNGHRLIRKVVHRAHDVMKSDSVPLSKDTGSPLRAPVVEFIGGFSGLANAIGMNDNDNSALRDLLQAGQHVEWQHKHAQIGGFWTWTATRGSRKGPGVIRMTIGDALCPGFAAALRGEGKRSIGARRARTLIPELHEEPPLAGLRRNEHGKVWTLHRLALVELVDSAVELYEEGGALITPKRWHEMGSKVGLSPAHVDRILSAWQSGDETAPPLLNQIQKDSWTLAQPHDQARSFIEETGRRKVEGSKRGKRSARKRQS